MRIAKLQAKLSQFFDALGSFFIAEQRLTLRSCCRVFCVVPGHSATIV